MDPFEAMIRRLCSADERLHMVYGRADVRDRLLPTVLPPKEDDPRERKAWVRMRESIEARAREK